MTSTESSCSSALATSPPQNDANPVMSTRRPMPPDLTRTRRTCGRAACRRAPPGSGPGCARTVHDAALRVALLVGRDVEVDRRQHLELELGREVGDRPEQGPEHHLVGGDGEVGEASGLARVGLPHDRHRLLGADHGDGDDGHTGPHGDLDEAAPTEPAQLVALAVRLARPLGALGEHEHELLLLAQQPVGVVGMGDDAAEAAPVGADDGHRLEDVVGQAVAGAVELGLDAVHDHRRVARDGRRRGWRRAAPRRGPGCARGRPRSPGTTSSRRGRRRRGPACASARTGPTRRRRSAGDRRARRGGGPVRVVAADRQQRHVGRLELGLRRAIAAPAARRGHPCAARS